MSSSEDSETAEWEREQMLRGTQSRGRQQQQQQQKYSSSHQQPSGPKNQENLASNPDVIDATEAKRHVKRDIDLVEQKIQVVKKNIGSTRVDIVKTEKRIQAIEKQIEKLDQANPFFEELSKLVDSDKVIELINRNRSLIARLPHDQKEMIDLLESNLQNTQTTMDVDD